MLICIHTRQTLNFNFVETTPLALKLYTEIEAKSAVAKLKVDKDELKEYNQRLILGRADPKDKDKDGEPPSKRTRSQKSVTSDDPNKATGEPPSKKTRSQKSVTSDDPNKATGATKSTAPRKASGGTKATKGRPKIPEDMYVDKELEEDLLQIAIRESLDILGREPDEMAQLSQFSLPDMPVEFFGCTTPQQYFRLREYLTLNGGFEPVQVQARGACMFAAFRRQIDCPEEYTNTHLRRQIIIELATNAEFFYPRLKLGIAGQYGAVRLTKEQYDAKCKDGTITEYEKSTYNEPGPFSYTSYLDFMLKRSTWGDEMMLMVLGMIFQVRLTMLNVTSLKATRFRHGCPIAQSDILMLLAGGNHYMAAGRHIYQYLY